MANKRILLVNGHPGQNSLSRLFVDTYAHAARSAGHDIRQVHLSDLNFDMDFGDGGYANPKPLESDLEQVLQSFEWADHIVMSTPMWWGGLPAKLKGLLDRILLPGRTFDTRTLKMGIPTPVLTGKTGRVIMTSDTPHWFMRLFYRSALIRQLNSQIFGFVGIKPTRITWFSGASHPKANTVDTWKRKIHKLGLRAA